MVSSPLYNHDGYICPYQGFDTSETASDEQSALMRVECACILGSEELPPFVILDRLVLTSQFNVFLDLTERFLTWSLYMV